MKILLVDDDPTARALFRAEMMDGPTPLIRGATLDERATPLDDVAEYHEYDVAIFDQHLRIWDPFTAEEITGYVICQRIHQYQYERNGFGDRVHKRKPTALMLLTGDDHEKLPINAREYVDQIAYKYGTGYRHVDDASGCLRAILRSLDRVTWGAAS